MRAVRLVLAFAASIVAAACGGKANTQSVCDDIVPPPAACMTECDPMPGAANTCPAGYHCSEDGFCDAACSADYPCPDGYECSSDGRCTDPDECQGLECNVVDCASMGMPVTTIKGTVYAPNGTLPLYGIDVYIPNAAVPPMEDGAQCARCSDELPGSPIAKTVTDTNGEFTLNVNVPAGTNIPLVIASGKWRRQIVLASVAQCTETQAPATDTRLPKNHTEGDMPRIALSTGSADSLECLLRRMGIDDTEIGKQGDPQRIHLFTDPGSGGGEGVNGFISGYAGGTGDFTDSMTTLWNSVDSLKPYDIVILSCEGQQFPETKPQTALDALKAYADLGGRVFLSHWHNIWIAGNYRTVKPPTIVTPDWVSIATWDAKPALSDGTIDRIDEISNPKGTAFADWMFSAGVMGSTTRGEISVDGGKVTALTLDTTKAERWTYIDRTAQEPQNFQFTTPVNSSADQRCGKVVFSDMHVSGDGGTPDGMDYPDSCGDRLDLTPQEKALAFMLFDLASCVQVIL